MKWHRMTKCPSAEDLEPGRFKLVNSAQIVVLTPAYCCFEGKHGQFGCFADIHPVLVRVEMYVKLAVYKGVAVIEQCCC